MKTGDEKCSHYGINNITMLKRIIKDWLLGKKPLALIPKLALSEILPPELKIEILEPDAKDGNVTLAELVIISQLVKLRKPQKIFEIGTFDGRTTLNLAKSSPDNAEIWTLDLKPGQVVKTSAGGDKKFMARPEIGHRFLGQAPASKIKQLFGDSSKFDFSPFYNSIDFIFIDGSHAYEYVKKDSQTALKIAKTRLTDGQASATILWHDYNTSWPGVTQALNELYQNDSRFKNLKNISGTSLVYIKL